MPETLTHDDRYGGPNGGPTNEGRRKTEANKAEADDLKRQNTIAKATDVVEARDTRDIVETTYKNTGNRVAPVVEGAQIDQAARMGEVDKVLPTHVSRTAPIVATTAAGPSNVIAPNLARAAAVQAGPIGASGIGPVERFSAAQVAPVVNAQATLANAAGINRGEDAQVRGAQLGYNQQLQNVAAGVGGPSAAEIQGRKQLQQGIAQQFAMAKAQKGYGGLSAMRAAQRNASGMALKAGLDNSLLRAQETATARGQLGTALTSTRGLDQNMAVTQAQLDQQAGLQNAQLGTNVNLANASAANSAASQQANLTQGASQFGAAAQNTMAQRQAELDQAANIATEEMALRAATTNQATDQQRTLAAAGLDVDAQKANQAAGSAMANMNAEQQTIMANATLEQQTQLTNAANSINQMQLDDAQKQNLLNSWMQANGMMLNFQTQQAQIAASKPKEGSFLGPLLGAAGAGIGLWASGGNPKAGLAGAKIGSEIGSG
jgi:hypothetical protein